MPVPEAKNRALTAELFSFHYLVKKKKLKEDIIPKTTQAWVKLTILTGVEPTKFPDVFPYVPCGWFSFDLCFPTSFPYWQIRSPMSSQRFPFCFPPVFNLSFLMHFSFSSVIPRVWQEFPSCFFMHLLARSLTNFPLPNACIGYAFSDAFARSYINDLCFSTSSPVCSVLSHPRVPDRFPVVPIVRSLSSFR